MKRQINIDYIGVVKENNGSYTYEQIVIQKSRELLTALDAMCKKRGARLYVPSIKLCGDNAAMVGAQGYFEFKKGNIASLDLNAFATMPIDASN